MRRVPYDESRGARLGLTIVEMEVAPRLIGGLRAPRSPEARPKSTESRPLSK